MAESPAGRSPSQRQASLGNPETAPSQHTIHRGPTGPAIQLAAGQRPLPEYELVHCLGRGGFGEVWKAKGPGGFTVALKFIRLSDGGGRVELRALELMKEIKHPHLLAQFGAWQLNDFLIVAMELADGTLAERLRQARAAGQPGIPRKDLLVYLFEAARGLDHLHSLNVQHRDVKPENLLLVGGGVKIADFGLARLIEHSLTSATGSMTMAYAAPELFQNQVSEHTDQYALAVTYCELRGGQRPFDGPPASVIAGHLRLPPDLSMLPKAEHAAVARALAKKPAERWPSCRAFVEALLQAGKQKQAKAPAPKPGKPASGAVPQAPKPQPTVMPRKGPVPSAQPTGKLEQGTTPGPTPFKVVPIWEMDEPRPHPAHRPQPVVETPKEPAPSPQEASATLFWQRHKGHLIGAGVLAGLLVIVLFVLWMESLSRSSKESTTNEPKVEKRKQDTELTPKPDPLKVVEKKSEPELPKVVEKKIEPVPPKVIEKKPEPEPPKVVEKKPKRPWVVKTMKNSLGMELALVPRGTSWTGGGGGWAGSTPVEIEYDFYLGVYEVTQEQWQTLMGNNPSTFSRGTIKYKDKVATVSDADLKRFPVEMVSWDMAQAFLVKLNALEKEAGWTYRLPRGAEWEYACRGAATSSEDCSWYYYFDKPTNEVTSEQANFGEILGRPSKVGSYRPNRLGIYDMHGNVQEWCEDFADGGIVRVSRGGCWAYDAFNCRVTARVREDKSDARWIDVGFRVARVPSGR